MVVLILLWMNMQVASSRNLFELYATGAFSMELLCKKLKKEHGLAWPKGSMGKMLNNPFYYGVMVVKGKEYPHRYPPIITQSLFEACTASHSWI